jgi:ribosomal protein L37E
MALITCDECGKKVSEKAKACPSCGNPIASVKHKISANKKTGIIYCDECGLETSGKVSRCTNCGYPLAPLKPKVSAKKNTELIKCHVCGKDISNKAKTCPHCGAPTRRTERIKAFFALAFLMALLLSVIVGFMAYQWSYDLLNP